VNNLTRRALLKAKFSSSRQAVRLPWVRNELEFTNNCTRCHDCMDDCPEKIIIKGEGGFPEINFTKGECTFCAECVKSCSENLFYSLDDEPWILKASITDDCLAAKKVVCLVCGEQCETEAISFIPKIGSVSEPLFSSEECTGCGACAKPCPTNAINFKYANEFYR
jgi:ferredoxin-type protein NapF